MVIAATQYFDVLMQNGPIVLKNIKTRIECDQ